MNFEGDPSVVVVVKTIGCHPHGFFGPLSHFSVRPQSSWLLSLPVFITTPTVAGNTPCAVLQIVRGVKQVPGKLCHRFLVHDKVWILTDQICKSFSSLKETFLGHSEAEILKTVLTSGSLSCWRFHQF